MRSVAALAFFSIGVGVAFGCDPFNNDRPVKSAQTPPPGYTPYPQPQTPPPGWDNRQPGYYPPPQPAPPSASTATASGAQPYNPWANLLSDLLKGGAPPIPWPGQPTPTPTTPTPPQPTPSTVDTRGLELANAINQYRAQNGLQPIPISKSLAKVADAHVKDLATATPMAAQCNDHSWTNRGTWTPCCYTADHAQAKCMWTKPSEITPFKGTGFEIALGQPGDKKAGLVLDAKQAITFWSTSPVHNDVILNKGQWSSMKWQAMGAGIVDSHASAWFSDQADSVTELKAPK
jgi:hypothetical protein